MLSHSILLFPQIYALLIVKQEVICQDFYAKFGSKMARISATATAPLFFALAPPRRAPLFSVRASSEVALKVAQVPSTAKRGNNALIYVKCILLNLG